MVLKHELLDMQSATATDTQHRGCIYSPVALGDGTPPAEPESEPESEPEAEAEAEAEAEPEPAMQNTPSGEQVGGKRAFHTRYTWHPTRDHLSLRHLNLSLPRMIVMISETDLSP